MIAYQAIREIAKEIGRTLACSPDKHVLLATPTNLSAVSAYQSFLAAAKSLNTVYEEEAKSAAGQAGPITPHIGPGFGEIAEPAYYGASALAAMKASTIQGGASFAPADQALYSDLEKYANCVVTMPSPGNYEAGSDSISKQVALVMKSREDAIAAYLKHFEEAQHDPKQQASYDPTANELKTAESAYAGFLGLLSGTTASSITMGAALEAATTKSYNVLTIADVAAGGSSRANTYFFVNLFIPPPAPSFNGGAVVSYTLRDRNGTYITGDTLRLLYGYTKWRPPSLRRKSGGGYVNFKWDHAAAQ